MPLTVIWVVRLCVDVISKSLWNRCNSWTDYFCIGEGEVLNLKWQPTADNLPPVRRFLQPSTFMWALFIELNLSAHITIWQWNLLWPMLVQKHHCLQPLIHFLWTWHLKSFPLIKFGMHVSGHLLFDQFSIHFFLSLKANIHLLCLRAGNSLLIFSCRISFPHN